MLFLFAEIQYRKDTLRCGIWLIGADELIKYSNNTTQSFNYNMNCLFRKVKFSNQMELTL